MNKLEFYTRIYGSLHNYGKMPYWLFTPVRRLVRWLAYKQLPKYLSRPERRGRRPVEKGLIVSFTSFPARIDGVWQVVESLKRQTILPEKIILWLSKDQFPTMECVPQNLWREEDGLFEIMMVEGDIRSHKKYYYVMQNYPECSFITCDDDVYYSPNMIRYLLDAARLNPNCIIANHTNRLTYNAVGQLLPYLQWGKNNTSYTIGDYFQVGIGGVLYPPHTLHELTLRKDLFMSLTPLADDIWLNCMARLNKTKVIQSTSIQLCLPVKSVAPTLSSVNNGSDNRNDTQICELRNWLVVNNMPDVYDMTYKIE